jgi:hypothetical protein
VCPTGAQIGHALTESPRASTAQAQSCTYRFADQNVAAAILHSLQPVTLRAARQAATGPGRRISDVPAFGPGAFQVFDPSAGGSCSVVVLDVAGRPVYVNFSTTRFVDTFDYCRKAQAIAWFVARHRPASPIAGSASPDRTVTCQTAQSELAHLSRTGRLHVSLTDVAPTARRIPSSVPVPAGEAARCRGSSGAGRAALVYVYRRLEESGYAARLVRAGWTQQGRQPPSFESASFDCTINLPAVARGVLLIYACS